MLSQVGQGNMYHVQIPQEGTFLVASGRLKSIVKHFGGWVKGKKMGGMIFTIYTTYDVCMRGVAFWDHDDCTCIKIFSGVNFLMAINSLHVNLTALVSISQRLCGVCQFCHQILGKLCSVEL